MLASREEIRQIYLSVWQKMQDQELLEPMEAMIANVIENHPEYHPLLGDDEAVLQQDYRPEHGTTNPFLHMGMHIALREQAATDRPPGIRRIHQRLVNRYGNHDAEHRMMECLGQALWNAQRNSRTPDDDTYLECLKKL